MSFGFVDPTGVGMAMGGRRARTKIRELDSAIRSLLSDVQSNVELIASQDGGTEFIRAFAAFEGEWRVWREEHADDLSVFFSSLFFALGGDLRRFIDRYNAFERQYRAFVGPPTVPGVYRPGESGETNWALVLGLGAVGVAGVFAIAWLTREGRLLVHESRSLWSPARTRSGVPGREDGNGMAEEPPLLLPSMR